MLLLDLMERVRIALLRQVVIGRQFELDLQNSFEQLIYPDDTAPYYAGEMMSNWKMPAVERGGGQMATVKKNSTKSDGKAAGFCMYIGPEHTRRDTVRRDVSRHQGAVP